MAVRVAAALGSLLLGAVTFGCGPATSDTPCVPRVEEHPNWNSASLRADRSDPGCQISEEAYRRVVREWLTERDAAAAPVSSLYLGRAVRLPWLSAQIEDEARGHAGWNPQTGRAREGHENEFVSARLATEDFRERLAAPFADSPFAVEHVSVEKVLVRETEPRLPFDAQVWLVLREGGGR